jgi:hypothetical protein
VELVVQDAKHYKWNHKEEGLKDENIESICFIKIQYIRTDVKTKGERNSPG